MVVKRLELTVDGLCVDAVCSRATLANSTMVEARFVPDQPGTIKNSNLQNSLVNKLQAAANAIQSGDYQGAASSLQNDVMGKTDGCAVSGAPDKNDWIVTCAAQRDVYTTLVEIIERIRDLAGR